MDTIAHHLRNMSSRLVIPRSIHGLVTPRLMVMHYVEGIPLMEVSSRINNLSARQQNIAKRLILSRYIAD